MLTNVLFLKNGQKNICIQGGSQIHKERSLGVSNTYKKKMDISPWIGEQPSLQMNFWQFSRNTAICVIPGKMS